MAQGKPPFGGTAGVPKNLTPISSPPRYGYRVIPANVWLGTILPTWQAYLNAQAAGTSVAQPPLLAPPGAVGVYFTDEASLQGIDDPLQFAVRVELPLAAQHQCDIHGCVIVRFKIPPTINVVVPQPHSMASMPGLSSGGAREWMTTGNVAIEASMEVQLIERDANGGCTCTPLPL